MYKSVAVDMYDTLLVDVICMYATLLVNVICVGINDHTSLGESGKLFLVIGHKIWLGSGGFIILFLRNVINDRGGGGERKDYAQLGQIDKLLFVNDTGT